MQSSQTPTLVPLAFAANGTKNTIPEASQVGITNGAASLNDGFPPLTFTPIAAGGVPPAGADFNGILNLITQSIRWAHGGGRYAFSSTFAADANVTGYPAGAELMSADLQGAWLSLNDSNTDNPDTGAGTKWVPSRAYGTTALTGLSNANVTLTPAQAAKNRITLAGALTANIQIIFPTWLRDWTIVNNTTGSVTITCKTASGSGVAIPQNGAPTRITGDGTNITNPAENVALATQAQHAAQISQVAGVVGQVRNLAMTVAAASATATLTADEIVVETALGGVRYCLASFSKTVNLATTGAGGMDTGTAPVSGFVALYAIFNPAGTSALLAVNATSAATPNVYGGANMPSGYTASALLTVVPTNASSQFPLLFAKDRRVNISSANIVSSTSVPPTVIGYATVSMTAVPKNARSMRGTIFITNSGTANSHVGVAPNNYGSNTGAPGVVEVAANTAAAQGAAGAFEVDIGTPQTIGYYAYNNVGGVSVTYSINVSSYEI